MHETHFVKDEWCACHRSRNKGLSIDTLRSFSPRVAVRSYKWVPWTYVDVGAKHRGLLIHIKSYSSSLTPKCWINVRFSSICVCGFFLGLSGGRRLSMGRKRVNESDQISWNYKWSRHIAGETSRGTHTIVKSKYHIVIFYDLLLQSLPGLFRMTGAGGSAE